MPAGTGFYLVNHIGPSRDIKEQFADYPSYERRLVELGKEIIARNTAARKSDPLICCCILREREREHRWLQLDTPVLTGAKREGTFKGGISQLEALFDGRWRLASIEEEAERRKQDDADARDARETNFRASEAARFGKAVADAIRG